MENINWSEVTEAQEGKRLPAGGYIIGITAAEDIPEKQYLRIEFDIADGEYKNYYRQMRDNLHLDNWPNGGVFIRSYKEKARPFFKAFVTSVEASNTGFKFNNDEKTLVRKKLGVVLGEEEYEYNGQVKTRLKVEQCRSVKKIQDGDFTVPDVKKLATSTATPSYSAGSNGDFAVIDDSNDLPF